MKRFILALALAAGLPPAVNTAQAAAFNQVQADKSAITFTYQQMGVKMDGKFRKFAAKLNFDGIDYLVERPLRADLAIVKAACADEKGNLVYRLSSRNFNPLVAMAGDFVVAETEKIVKAGEIDPEQVMTPGILVDALILAGEK